MAKFRGTNGNDTIVGTDFDDIIYGRRGDDTLYTGDGDDVVYGGGGKDTIIAGSGNNDVYGGGGRDTYAFEAGASGVTTLQDWQDGRDTIDLSGLGITSLNDVTITTSGGWTTISAGNMDIRMDAASNSTPLSADDFIFADVAPPPPPPVPTNGTLYTFDNMSWLGNTNPDEGTRSGDFVADWSNFAGYNEGDLVGTNTNGLIYAQNMDPYSGVYESGSVRADMSVMTQDTFDLESFKTNDTDGFTLIAYNDGVEVGRETFAGSANGDWVEIQPDDAIFDQVDEVAFAGISWVDDALFLA